MLITLTTNRVTTVAGIDRSSILYSSSSCFILLMSDLSKSVFPFEYLEYTISYIVSVFHKKLQIKFVT